MPGAARPGRALSLPALLLLAAADDYLLEIERHDAEAAWRNAFPEGELVTFQAAPEPAKLIGELTAPSLFASARLLVVRDAGAYLEARPKKQAGDLKPLLDALASLRLDGVFLLLAAQRADEPSGPLAELVRARGEVRFLPLPAAPKPWEEVRVTPPQRAVLAGIVRRVAPAVLESREAFDALCEAYGFRPRELAQAAERLALAGAIDAAAVRLQAGPGECGVRDIEEALVQRDAARAAALLARLATGATLVDWRGEPLASERIGAVLAGTIGRLLRQALAARAHAARLGISAELEPRRCRERDWYPRTFKTRVYPKLAKDAEGQPGSPIAGLTAWQMQRCVKAAAHYRQDELLAALGHLGTASIDRMPHAAALATLIPLVLGLTAPK